MKVKVSEASGYALDYMVAKCEGWPLTWDENTEDFFLGLWAPLCFLKEYTPSTNWAQGGPILTRERISRTIDHSGLWIAYWADGYTDGDEGNKWMQCDRCELVAGLRCYVVSKLGEEVEVPDELT